MATDKKCRNGIGRKKPSPTYARLNRTSRNDGRHCGLLGIRRLQYSIASMRIGSHNKRRRVRPGHQNRRSGVRPGCHQKRRRARPFIQNTRSSRTGSTRSSCVHPLLIAHHTPPLQARRESATGASTRLFLVTCCNTTIAVIHRTGRQHNRILPLSPTPPPPLRCAPLASRR